MKFLKEMAKKMQDKRKAKVEQLRQRRKSGEKQDGSKMRYGSLAPKKKKSGY